MEVQKKGDTHRDQGTLSGTSSPGGKDRVVSCFSLLIAQFRCLTYLDAGKVLQMWIVTSIVHKKTKGMS